jgi:hypothetical protein
MKMIRNEDRLLWRLLAPLLCFLHLAEIFSPRSFLSPRDEASARLLELEDVPHSPLYPPFGRPRV